MGFRQRRWNNECGTNCKDVEEWLRELFSVWVLQRGDRVVDGFKAEDVSLTLNCETGNISEQPKLTMCLLCTFLNRSQLHPGELGPAYNLLKRLIKVSQSVLLTES